MRCDILIERRVIGRILGKGGRDLEALQLSTATKVFVIDKYPPPNEGDDHRLLVLIGQPDALRVCKVCDSNSKQASKPRIKRATTAR